MPGRKNREMKGLIIGVVLLILGFLMITTPFLFDDMMSWGFASIFTGILVFIIGIVLTFMYKKRVNVHKRMFESNDKLAHWFYDSVFWQEEIKEDLEGIPGLKVMGYVLGGLFLIIGIAIFSSDPDDNSAFMLIMLGFAVFFILVSQIAAHLNKKRLLNDTGEAVITRDGLYFKSQLYSWDGITSYLESVSPDPSATGRLLFVYRMLAGRRVPKMRRSSVSIPVPSGQEQTAMNIIAFYNLPLSQELYESMLADMNENGKP